MLQLTAPALRQMLPRAPQGVIDAFAAPEGQAVLAKAGILTTRPRCSVAFAQVSHETDCFTIKDLTENIHYSAEGAAKTWPSRFPGGASQVRAKYGTEPGWQAKLIDDVYGGRMGNHPGTHDGSTYIGRGGPQITGRDGYRETGKRAGMDLESSPALACKFDLQPQMLAAFWTWKNLSPVVDTGGLKAATKPWNGGYIGLADRQARERGIEPVVARLAVVNDIAPAVKGLPGGPPTPAPPKEATDEATKNERKARTAGAGGAVAGGGNEGAKTQTQQSDKTPLLPSPIAYGLIAVGVAVVVIATILIAKKKAAVVSNWF